MMTVAGQGQYMSHDTHIKNIAFSNVVVVTRSVKTFYGGGQDAAGAPGTTVSREDFNAQTEQFLKNIQAALFAGGGADASRRVQP